MAPAPIERALHIKDAITTLRSELAGHDLDTLVAAPLQLAGMKYLLLVIGEAAGRLPDDWQRMFGPQINWRRVADLSNVLRHAYHHTNAELLWEMYETDLDPLEAAIDAMLAAHATPPPPAKP